ncbi:hypothetical protein PLEOSDRAFT_1081002 [Pleurotus ostreatus PC15]|uniref:Uncharacterized protein n=1 Tax=Pleurotus ostreatus (strain PC15) TaxID=1137138 RepID=A0A067PDN4_PLEO1|nr:hypothetical protein PLEOSDRAFT_1081002 [Pleurotus ostreatus PC15]
MDIFYNKTDAVQVLDELIAERVNTASSPQMYGMNSEGVERFGLTILKEGADVASKLTQHDEATGEAEEASIAIQGIISGCQLPPFDLKANRPDEIRRLAHVRQSVTITGLGSTSFKSIAENCRHMHTMFGRYTPNALLQSVPEYMGKLRNENGCDDDYPTITASTRFFTPAKQASGFATVDVNPELDPRGVLSKVDAAKWVHTEDNAVGYYILACSDTEASYKPTTPVVFQIGDIVELQTLMLSVPTKGKYSVKLILRSIVLLNGHFTTEAISARTLAAEASRSVPVPR